MSVGRSRYACAPIVPTFHVGVHADPSSARRVQARRVMSGRGYGPWKRSARGARTLNSDYPEPGTFVGFEGCVARFARHEPHHGTSTHDHPVVWARSLRVFILQACAVPGKWLQTSSKHTHRSCLSNTVMTAPEKPAPPYLDGPSDVAIDPDREATAHDDDSCRDPDTNAEKRLVRKLDMTLLPMAWVLYMFNYLDRNNIALVSQEGCRSCRIALVSY